MKKLLRLKKSKGFTLIELMIVVAIIGILAAVALPKFADLIAKSKEAAVKATLGSLRSAMSIYYGDNEGIYPAQENTTLVADLSPEYMPVVAGVASLGKYDIPKHSTAGTNPGHSHGSVTAASKINESSTTADDDRALWYQDSTEGIILVACTHNDTKGTQWTAN